MSAVARKIEQEAAPDRVVMETGAMAAAMAELAKVVEGKQLLPILENVLIEPHEAGLLLTTTNLDMQYSVPIGIVSGALPAVTLQAKRLLGVLQGLDDGSQASLAIEEGRLILRSGRSRATLPVIAADIFPKMAEEDTDTVFRMEAATLRAGLDAVRFAMGRDEVQYQQCGVNLSVADGALTFAAFDGTRLAAKAMPAPEGIEALEGADDIILPAKLVTLLAGLEGAGWHRIALGRRRRIVVGTASGRTIVAKLIDAQFAPFRKIVGEETTARLVVPREMLARALGRVRLMADDQYRSMALSFAADTLTLRARAKDGAEIVEDVPCEWDGPPLDMPFSSKLLGDQIDALEGDTLEMLRGDEERRRFWFRGADEDAHFVLQGMKF